MTSVKAVGDPVTTLIRLASMPTCRQRSTRKRPTSSSPTRPTASTGNGAPRRLRSTEALAPLPPPWRSWLMMTAMFSWSGQWSTSLLRSTHQDPPQMMPVRVIASASALQRRLGDLALLVECERRLELLLGEMVVIGIHRLFRLHVPLHHGAHEADDRDRVLGEVDLAAEQRDACAVALGLGDQLEGVAGRALGAAEDADDQPPRIVARQFLHRPRAVVLELEELRLVALH